MRRALAILLLLAATGCMSVWRPMADMGCMGAGWRGVQGADEKHEMPSKVRMKEAQ